MFGPERDELGGRLNRHLNSHLQTNPADHDLAGFVSSHLSKPGLDLSSHLNRDLNYHLRLTEASDLTAQMCTTEHQLDIRAE